MIRHLRIRFNPKCDELNKLQTWNCEITDYDTGEVLGNDWVKIDKSWVLAMTYPWSHTQLGTFTICCLSNADKTKSPMISHGMFYLPEVDLISTLETSTDGWYASLLTRPVYEMLKRFNVTRVYPIVYDKDPKGLWRVSVMEHVAGDKVINPIEHVYGFEKMEERESQNPFEEIHTKVIVFRRMDKFELAPEKSYYILQRNADGTRVLYIEGSESGLSVKSLTGLIFDDLDFPAENTVSD